MGGKEGRRARDGVGVEVGGGSDEGSRDEAPPNAMPVWLGRRRSAGGVGRWGRPARNVGRMPTMPTVVENTFEVIGQAWSDCCRAKASFATPLEQLQALVASPHMASVFVGLCRSRAHEQHLQISAPLRPSPRPSTVRLTAPLLATGSDSTLPRPGFLSAPAQLGYLLVW